jgi:hypothetical protein
MNVIKIFIILLFLFLTPVAALAADVTDAQYTGTISISSSTEQEAAMGWFTLSSKNLASLMMCENDFSDIAVIDAGANDIQFMPVPSTDNWAVFVPAIMSGETKYDYVYSKNVTGGELRYFPGNAGMVTPDAATLEFGSNFKYETSGYIDTNKPGCIVNKNSAISMGVWDGDLIASKLNGVSSWGAMGGASSAIGLYTGNYTRAGTEVFIFEGVVNSIGINLTAIGTPPGNYNITVRDAVTDALITTLYTATAASAAGAMTIDIPPMMLYPSDDVYFLVEYDDGDVSNYLEFTGYATGGGDAQGVRYNGAYTAGNNSFLIHYSVMNAAQLVSTAITSGEKQIELWADGTDMFLEVNNVVADSVALVGGITGNANDYTSFTMGIMPWVEYQKITTSGTLRQDVYYDAQVLSDLGGTWDWYNFNDVLWGTDPVFVDHSGNNNDATPTFPTAGTSGLTAALTSYQPKSLYTVPLSTEVAQWELIPTNPGSPTHLFDEMDMSFFGAGWVQTFADDTDTPVDIWVVCYALGSALLLGLGAYAISRSKITGQGSLLAQSLVSLAVVAYFTISGAGALSAWLLFPFGLELALLLFKREPSLQ